MEKLGTTPDGCVDLESREAAKNGDFGKGAMVGVSGSKAETENDRGWVLFCVVVVLEGEVAVGVNVCVVLCLVCGFTLQRF